MVEGSISLFFWQDPNGYQLAQGGASASIDLGSISAYGTPNGLLASNFTKGMDADGFHLTTPFQVQVVEANLPSSTGYALTAYLGDNDDTVWEVDGQFLSTTPALLSAAEPYTAKRQHILYVKFPFTKSTQTNEPTRTLRGRRKPRPGSTESIPPRAMSISARYCSKNRI